MIRLFPLPSQLSSAWPNRQCTGSCVTPGSIPRPVPSLPEHRAAGAEHPKQAKAIGQHVERFAAGAEPVAQPFPLVHHHQPMGRIPA